MTEKITLELPDQVVQKAQLAAKRTGRAVEQILVDWLAREAGYDLQSIITPGLEYPIYTPLGNEAAAQVLLDTLKAHKEQKDKSE